MAPPIPKSPVSPARVTSRSNMAIGNGQLPLLPLTTAPDPTSLLNSLDHRRATDGPLDPLDFLNKHYPSESSLVMQLPALRDAVSSRMSVLDDRIADALQRQSETAQATRRRVQEARASVEALEHRIRQVQAKAAESESAVISITADMKRLDCAKRHLQRTITALKRLHMLVNAVEQLRVTTITKPFPDYLTASRLVEATRLLIGHFDGYTHKVEPMRLLAGKVEELQTTLQVSFVRAFRLVAFGLEKTKELEGVPKKKNTFLSDPDEEEEEVVLMTPDVMQGGIALVDALGDDVRERFIHDFCQDHLSDYLKEFEPPSREKKPEKRVSSFKVQEAKAEEAPHAGLDHIEKRFTWFREVLQQVDRKFPKVFPSHWNVQASLARHFLQLVRVELLVSAALVFVISGHVLTVRFNRLETTFLLCWMARERMRTPTTPRYCSRRCKRPLSLKRTLPAGCSESTVRFLPTARPQLLPATTDRSHCCRSRVSRRLRTKTT